MKFQIFKWLIRQPRLKTHRTSTIIRVAVWEIEILKNSPKTLKILYLVYFGPKIIFFFSLEIFLASHTQDKGPPCMSQGQQFNLV